MTALQLDRYVEALEQKRLELAYGQVRDVGVFEHALSKAISAVTGGHEPTSPIFDPAEHPRGLSGRFRDAFRTLEDLDAATIQEASDSSRTLKAMAQAARYFDFPIAPKLESAVHLHHEQVNPEFEADHAHNAWIIADSKFRKATGAPAY